MDKRNNFNAKLTALKELGFSDDLLTAIEQGDNFNVMCSEEINYESIENPFSNIPNDSNKIFIELTDKPMDIIYNAD